MLVCGQTCFCLQPQSTLDWLYLHKFAFSNIPYEGTYIICCLFCLASFTEPRILDGHLCCCVYKLRVCFRGWIVFLYTEIPLSAAVHQWVDMWIVLSLWLLGRMLV